MPVLAKKMMCTGCTACVSICPQKCLIMTTDKNGFFYPELTKEDCCINCKLCEKVCPVINQKRLSEEKTYAYAAYSKDENLRAESSSGGIFSEVAKIILAQEGVVYGALYSKDFVVEHKGITEEKDLYKLRGAKYSQSDLKTVFLEVQDNLKQGKKVLFSGTPCSVAGLKSFLQKDYENLLCIDFVCHGIPAPRVWKEYVEYRALKDNHESFPSKINLRSKHTGWSRYRYSNLYEYADGIFYSALSGEDLFMKLFVEDYINRESCGNCMFKGYQRHSDLTIADFWGIWDILPEMDDNKGTSAVLIHSEKGKKVFESILEKMQVKEVSLEQISQQNPSMLMSSKPNGKRNEILRMTRSGQMEKIGSILRTSAMKKIGIITINDPINYGNRLQNYAMQIFLENFGYDVKTIPNEKYADDFYVRIKCKMSYRLRKTFPKLWSLYKKESHELIQDEKDKKEQELLEMRAKSFCAFNSRYMKNHDYVIRGKYVPGAIKRKYDYFVVGSDQIWNPKYGFGKHTTYLQFARKSQRIAIAPSFGIETIPECHKKLIAKYLKKMQYLSVREESGKRIVKELTGLECDVIMDPTLIVGAEEWENMIDECEINLPKKYVLTYFLGEISQERENYIKNYAAKNQLNIIHMNHVGNPEVFAWGPEAFLKAIKNCEYFFTDSFHGCVFSILFHKQFAVFRRKDRQENMFGRIETLLKTVGLMKCVTDECENLHEDISVEEYQNVDQSLEKERRDIIMKIEQILK